jgi:hypothetical protein
MKAAIINYTLKRGKITNTTVKAALDKWLNTRAKGVAEKPVKPIRDSVHFPDTTVAVAVPDDITSKSLLVAVVKIIRAHGGEASRVHVAFMDPATDCVFNAEIKPVPCAAPSVPSRNRPAHLFSGLIARLQRASGANPRPPAAAENSNAAEAPATAEAPAAAETSNSTSGLPSSPQ